MIRKEQIKITPTDSLEYVNDNLRLKGDVANPGSNKTYGTDASGNRVWKADSSGGGGGQVDSIVAGTGISVTNTDPVNPVVNLDSASIASLALADTASQPGHTHTASDVTDFQSAISANTDVAANTAYRGVGHIPLTEKAANNGVATLDAGGKIPASQLPSTVMEFKGTWDASTNTPTLANGTGDTGDVYLTSVAGTVNFGAGNITFEQGDWVVYNGSIWEKSINSNAVVSVNGQQGVVSLTTADVVGVNTIDNTLLADMAGHTVKVRADSSSGDPSDLVIGSHAVLGRNNGNLSSLDASTNTVLRRNTGNTLEFGKIGTNHFETAVNTSLGLADTAVQSDSSNTLTNKRIQPRTSSSTSAPTLTPDLSIATIFYRTTQTVTLTIEAPTGTPVIGESIMVKVSSAAAQTLNMDTIYKPYGAAFPATTTAGKDLIITATFNGTDWDTFWAVKQ